jgi:hypothetical protein
VSRIRLAVLLLSALLAAGRARAGFFGRDKVASKWTPKPVKVDGDDSDWQESSAFEEDGLSVLARNDGSDLYLLITAHTREARDQLSGESHQDLSLWFVSADGKTRKWGARIPYSRRTPLSNALRDPAGVDPQPEQVAYEGTAVSSSAFPDDVEDRLAMSARRPVWEVKLPLKRLELNADGAVAVDFVVNAPPGGVRRAKADAPAERAEAPTDGGGDQSRRGKGGRRGAEAGAHGEELVWNALSYSLSIRLARDPALPPR